MPPTSRRRFLKSVGAAGCSLSLTGTPATFSALKKATDEIHVGARRQLLFDDFLLHPGSNRLGYQQNIRWTVGRMEKSPTGNLFHADQPWEDDFAWHTVLYDEGVYRLWYHLSKNAERRPKQLPEGACVGYAESDDGINWRKPRLKLVDRYGFQENNIVFGGGPDAWSMELGNVFKDPSAPPEERYKMLYPCWESKHIYLAKEGVPYVGEAGVLRGAYSPDGLNWQRYNHIFLGKYTDSQNVATYDPVLGKYVAYIRAKGVRGGLDVGDHPVKETDRGRSVARIESDDFRHWSYPEIALQPDFQDSLNTQLYNPGYSHYEGADHAHFMFPSAIYMHDGKLTPQVAVSRDNRRWLRPTREPLISMGPESSFDEYMIWVSPGFVPLGRNKMALYYRSANVPHHGKRLTDRTPQTGMGRVVFKKDRILGIEAGETEGTFLTRPLIFEGGRLIVNAEPTGPDPQLRVQLVASDSVPVRHPARGTYLEDEPVQGMTFDDAVPITGDDVDGEVRWQSDAQLADWNGRPVQLQFRIRSMRIYAFQFMT